VLILITGGLGFIGSHLSREFLENGESVIATGLPSDTPATFLTPYLGKGLQTVILDISTQDAVADLCARHRVDSIIHLAGPLIGALSPGEEYRQNTVSLMNVLEAARTTGVRRLSIASSIGVYFGVAKGPLREDVPVRLDASHPIEAYKKAEELMGLYYAKAAEVDFVALRLGSIYGPLYRSRRHLPARLTHAGVAGVEGPISVEGIPPLYGDDHATDFCYVTDCARGIRLVHQSTRLAHRVYNIGGGQDVPNERYLAAAREVFPTETFRLTPGRSEGHWPQAVLDITRARADTGYEPCFSPELAMQDYARWLRAGNPL
jgi:UDP-glucose 4-epimerase